MIEIIKEKYRQFQKWQQQPYQVAPMSEETHQCATCGTQFQGNFCPRCGQSSKIGRYSFKNAFLLFLDVWGLGNRGMFRTIRDLILRPGYMIRDYLQGMQMAYYPPFKMFFLFIALSLLVETGVNIRMEDRLQVAQEQFSEGMSDSHAKEQEETSDKDEEKKELLTKIDNVSDRVYDWTMKHLGLVSMLGLLLFSGPLYLFFRKSPAYPGIRFSEFFVAMVYSMNMVEFYSILSEFFCLSMVLEGCFLMLIVIPIKQLSGYGYWRTLLNFFLAMIVFFVFILAAIIAVFFLISLFYTS